MLRNEAQCGMKNISLPEQFNLSSSSGREESCSGFPTQQTKRLGCARFLLSKYLILNNHKKLGRANMYFSQDLFPLITKKTSKKEFRKNPRFTPEPTRSHGAWRAARQAGRKSGKLVMETCLCFIGSSSKQRRFCKTLC